MNISDGINLYLKILAAKQEWLGLGVSAYIKLLGVLKFTSKNKTYSVSIYITRES